MTVTVAKNKNVLKQRLMRFFDENNESRKPLKSFFDELSEKGSIYIFGGLVRDLALFGIRKFDSDIDLVYTNNGGLEAILEQKAISINKFGGYRLKLEEWDLDLWEAKNTWAFKNGLKQFREISSMLDTTITNWDSVLFSWSDKEIICRESYFKDLQEKYLDIVLKENPNDLGLIVKLLRFCAIKEVEETSRNIANLLLEGLSDYSVDEVLNYEKSSYDKVFLSSRLIDNLLSEINHKDDLFPVRIPSYNRTSELFNTDNK